MLTIKVPKKEAEKTKQSLIKKRALSTDYIVKTTKTHIYFPLTKKIKTKYEILEQKLKKYKKQNTNLKENLLKKLTKKEEQILKTAFDIVGDIAVLEIDAPLEKKEKLIAETLLKLHKNIKTVVRKHGAHHGTYRTQRVKILAGKRTKETIHRENNVKIKLDIEKVYYSPRLSTERKRLSEQVKPNESVLVMFSGNAPYVSVISKNTKAKEVYGIEINPDGHKYGLETVKLNKLKNVKLFCGDVNDLMPKFKKQKKKFDRIIMPLPKSYKEFLQTAFLCAHKGTIIHLYAFLKVGEFNKAKEIIKKECKKAKLKHKFLKLTKCGQIKPKEYRICADFQII